MSCYPCMLVREDFPGTPAQAALSAIALGFKVGDLCALHRAEAGKLQQASLRGSQRRTDARAESLRRRGP